MTPVQIAYFKHFLFDSGVQAIYISMYRNSRIKGDPSGDKNGNPESLEQFFQEQPYFRVIMHAFYFPINSDFGHDYWDEINKKWKKYWELHEDNPNNSKVVTFKGTFAILRQNWDSQRYWKSETMEATYTRMKMEPPLRNVDLEKVLNVPRRGSIEPKFKVGDIIKGEISGDILRIESVDEKQEIYHTSDGGIIDFDKEEYWNLTGYPVAPQEAVEKLQAASEQVKKSEPGSLLEGFTMVEAVNPHGGRKMSTNTVSVNLRNGGYRITFSSKQSDKLRKIKYKFVKYLTKEDTKEIALIFNNSSGCGISFSDNRNLSINSKDIVEHIHKFYGLQRMVDYFTLEITATIQQDTNTIFKLKLKE